MNSTSRSDELTLSDEALIEMLRLDHGWALKEIFDRYNVKLFRLAWGVLRDDAIAKDVVQNVFIDLWNRRHTSNIQIVFPYLSRAVKFQVLKQIRDAKLHQQHVETTSTIEFTNQTEEAIDYKELEALLEEAISELSPRCREVFQLSRYENLSHKEISARLNISTKTVEVQIGKALSFLREKLSRLFPLLLILFY
jgi:RNA polymerase sigma-70 factor (ECF subfamily)